MSIGSVREYLKTFGKEKEIQEFSVSSATVELAAAALHTQPERIAKTLSFYDGEDACVLIVAAGDAKVDNSKYKQQFGMKAKMLSPNDVERLTGHAIGGVCPFANPDSVRVYTDISLQRFPVVYPACGSSNSAIALTTEELFSLSRSLDWVDVCKNWEIEK